ncbi:glycosyltransferase [Chamaesiphon sp. VAR_48_metabat_135_sub]|uniref:glycosyltransferase n=1 Tax=Chamaesiphon sp. VAR_48_metabat_135_sub TaxID=2964699 RepID=UPI00286D4CA1|nr:glycosyltransferase [Chamaesiphon sp. VAR_48_metabat_135_sub]
MKVAIHNEFFETYCAETELARRICIAGARLGWEVIEVGSADAIKSFNPDFVLALHFMTPKLTGFPTYGCMWNPTSFFEQWNPDRSRKNILSYDGYLSSSPQIEIWLKDILFGRDKKCFIYPDFYPSCHQTPYQQPQLENPQLVYIGTNWDGNRYQELFERLDRESYMQVYGPSEAWKYLRLSHQGSLPFDGESLVTTLNKAGIGLCLHKQQHIDAAVPSMRIFEIVAAGAVAICEEHPFIERAFGDSVLYIESNSSPKSQVLQISKHVQWVKNNQQQALEMSRRAHQIFTEKYSLEHLLLNILPYHQELIVEKGFIKAVNLAENQEKLVEIIVRIGDRSEKLIRRCFDSLANQTYKNIRVVLVIYKQLPHLNCIIEKYQDRLDFKLVNSEPSGFRSTQMTAGLNAISADYFGILDDDDAIHPNHIYTLVNILDRSPEIGVAYSGAICNWESDEPDSKLENSELAHFEPFNINKLVNLDNFIVSNSFITRRNLLDKNMLEDPKLEVVEDFFLLMNLCRKTKFSFSYEVTCEFYWRSSKKDNSTFMDNKIWKDSANRIRNMFWGKDFDRVQFVNSADRHDLAIDPSITKEMLNSLSIEELQVQLNNAFNIIESMESTKFWKLRKQWFKLKTALGLVKPGE